MQCFSFVWLAKKKVSQHLACVQAGFFLELEQNIRFFGFRVAYFVCRMFMGDSHGQENERKKTPTR